MNLDYKDKYLLTKSLKGGVLTLDQLKLVKFLKNQVILFLL